MKKHCNESQKLSSQRLFFEVSFLRFNFVSPLQYWHCYYNEYTIKQTASFYIKLPLKPTFFCFCHYWKDEPLYLINNYFKLIYLWISRTVLGNCPRGKLSPSPNSNANPKPNPDPDWGAIFLGGNFPDTI